MGENRQVYNFEVLRDGSEDPLTYFFDRLLIIRLINLMPQKVGRPGVSVVVKQLIRHENKTMSIEKAPFQFLAQHERYNLKLTTKVVEAIMLN